MSKLILDKKILDAITRETKIFLAQHDEIDYKSISNKECNSNECELSEYTVALYIYGKINFTILISFEENLLKNIVQIFLKNKNISEADKQDIYDGIIKEALNIIVGLAIGDFFNDEERLDITVPVRVKDFMIKKNKNIEMFSEILITKFGKLSISIIDDKIKEIEIC